MKRTLRIGGRSHIIGDHAGTLAAPAEESNQDAPLSVERRRAADVIARFRLVHAATMFWSVPSSMISKIGYFIRFADARRPWSRTAQRPCSARLLPLKPATPKSDPPSRIRLALLRLKRTVLRSDSNKGP